MDQIDIKYLNSNIVQCRKCDRLINYIEKIRKEKKNQFKTWDYWGRPVPGFGDKNACILIVGLAPAAHGGNRTGRTFTGDESGKWVIKALYEIKYSNYPESISRTDGLKLTNVYLTNVVHCAPPFNRPTREEILNCKPYLKTLIHSLTNLKVIITLGKLAFDSVCEIFSVKSKFSHNNIFKLDNYYLISSYHPSPRNTRTGRLTWNSWLSVFNNAKRICENS